MSAEYDLRKRPLRKGEENRQLLYPEIVSKGTISTNDLIKIISQESSFSPGDISGLLTTLEWKISNYIRDGFHVQFGEIGYFSASLKSRPIEDKKEIRSPSIYFNNVNFRPTANFRRMCRGRVERASVGFQESTEIRLEERREKMLEFIRNHPFMTRKNYTALTGLLKNRALTDLNLFIEEGLLTTKGTGSHKIYLSPEMKSTFEEEENTTMVLHLGFAEP